MILGLGLDIVDSRRIADLWQRFGRRFSDRILAEAEQPAFQALADPVPYLARRFAAKEAVAKALGTGIGAMAGLKEIATLSGPAGQPLVRLSGAAALRLQVLCGSARGGQVLVTLTDEPPYALAMAVIEGFGDKAAGSLS